MAERSLVPGLGRDLSRDLGCPHNALMKWCAHSMILKATFYNWYLSSRGVSTRVGHECRGIILITGAMRHTQRDSPRNMRTGVIHADPTREDNVVDRILVYVDTSDTKVKEKGRFPEIIIRPTSGVFSASQVPGRCDCSFFICVFSF